MFWQFENVQFARIEEFLFSNHKPGIAVIRGDHVRLLGFRLSRRLRLSRFSRFSRSFLRFQRFWPSTFPSHHLPKLCVFVIVLFHIFVIVFLVKVSLELVETKHGSVFGFHRFAHGKRRRRSEHFSQLLLRQTFFFLFVIARFLFSFLFLFSVFLNFFVIFIIRDVFQNLSSFAFFLRLLLFQFHLLLQLQLLLFLFVHLLNPLQLGEFGHDHLRRFVFFYVPDVHGRTRFHL